MIDLALDNRIILKNDIDLFIQELDILFNTSKTELIGKPDFGSSFQDYLWELELDTNEIVAYTKRLISENCVFANKYTVDVNCEMIEGEYRYIYLLQITIYYQNEQKAVKTYQFR